MSVNESFEGLGFHLHKYMIVIKREKCSFFISFEIKTVPCLFLKTLNLIFGIFMEKCVMPIRKMFHSISKWSIPKTLINGYDLCMEFTFSSLLMGRKSAKSPITFREISHTTKYSLVPRSIALGWNLVG